MADIVVEELVSNLGRKIRALREEAGLSLQQLSERASVSPTAIHKIEKNEMVSTIRVMMKIASALGRPVGYFLGEETGNLNFENEVEFTPASKRRLVTSRMGSTLVEHLAFRIPEGRIYSAIFTHPPGKSCRETRASHHGEEFVLILEGRMRWLIAEKEFLLGPGDSIHFISRVPHWWEVVGDEPSKSLWVMVPPPYGATEIW
jgi:transcriptional regulator with XRE-family HTH domain